MWGLELSDLDAVIDRALHEDLPGADVTAMYTVPEGTMARGHVVVREDVVVCGQAVGRRVFARVDPSLSWEVVVDGTEACRRGADVEWRGDDRLRHHDRDRCARDADVDRVEQRS